MMNELNKRANLLIEQLEVITFSLFLSFLSCSQPWIYMWGISNRCDVISPESKQTRTHNNLSKLLKPTPQELYLSKKTKKKTSIDLAHGPAGLYVPVITCNQMHFYGFPLQKISEDFQQRLEDQLQGAIEICGQLDHVQKFITWATTHHCRGPVLFSRALVRLTGRSTRPHTQSHEEKEIHYWEEAESSSLYLKVQCVGLWGNEVFTGF